MKHTLTLLIAFIFCCSVSAHAENTGASKRFVEQIGKGEGCTGESVPWEKGQEKARADALKNAKSDANERAATSIKAYSHVEGSQSVEEYRDFFNLGIVRELEPPTYSEPKLKGTRGYCTEAVVKTEVTIDEELLQKMALGPQYSDDPAKPFNIRLSTDKQKYKHGDGLKITVKGNRDFYLRVTTYNPKGTQLVIFSDNTRKFQRGVEHELEIIEVDCTSKGSVCGEEQIKALGSTHKFNFDPDTSGTLITRENIAEHQQIMMTKDLKLKSSLLSGGQTSSDQPQALVSESQVIVFTEP